MGTKKVLCLETVKIFTYSVINVDVRHANINLNLGFKVVTCEVSRQWFPKRNKKVKKNTHTKQG